MSKPARRTSVRLHMLCFLAAGALCAAADGREAEELAAHILKTRGEPLRELSDLREIHVRDFGAVPDDGINDDSAIRAALAEAGKSGGNAKILFDPGRYEIDPGGGAYLSKEEPLFAVKRLKNLVVDGQGAEIVIRRPSIGFCRIENSTNVIFRNFTVDYDPLPFSQGKISGADFSKGWIEVEVDEGFPDLSDPFFDTYNSWGMLKDPARSGKLKDGAPNVLFRSSCEKIGESLFRITLKKPFDEFLQVGDLYAQVGRASGGCEYFNSEQVTFENITFHAVPGSLFVGSGTARLSVLNCRGKLKENRLLVSGADGVHVQGARIGPWVEGCEFEGLSDDCLNIYSLPYYVLDVIAPEKLKMSSPHLLRAGDRLVFFRPQSGTLLLETRVLSVEKGIVTLEHPVPELNLAPQGTPYDHRGWKIYDHAYNPDATGNYFVYRNNYMHDGRRFGAFIKASYGLIENNRFEWLSDPALTIKNEPGWPEGFRACNLVIRGNQILDCSYANSRVPVDVDWQKLGYQSAGLPLQQNIFFENNRVRALSGPAARFDCVDGLTLRNNVFESGSSSGPLVTGENTIVRRVENNTDQRRIELK